jgi:hypothetical protein
MIKYISYNQIYEIWQTKLWPNRLSKIEPNSSMCFLAGVDINNMYLPSTFIGLFVDEKLVGVNSGHLCSDKSYRSRGLYVDIDYRGFGYGVELLTATVNIAIKNKAKFIWSLPRQTSWKTYKSAGFKLASNWTRTETSESNAYCYKVL